MLCHGEASVGGQPLESRCGVLGVGDHEEAPVRGSVFADLLDHALDRRGPLPDRDVDAEDVALTLVDDGVDRQGGLAGGPIADDQLSLSPADGEHRVHHRRPCFQRHHDGRAVDDRGRRAVGRFEVVGGDGATIVERSTQRVDDAAEQGVADGDLDDPARAAHDLSGRCARRAIEEHATDLVFPELNRLRHRPVRKLEELVEGGVRQARHASDAVTYVNDTPDALHDGCSRETPDPSRCFRRPEVQAHGEIAHGSWSSRWTWATCSRQLWRTTAVGR